MQISTPKGNKFIICYNYFNLKIHFDAWLNWEITGK